MREDGITVRSASPDNREIATVTVPQDVQCLLPRHPLFPGSTRKIHCRSGYNIFRFPKPSTCWKSRNVAEGLQKSSRASLSDSFSCGVC